MHVSTTGSVATRAGLWPVLEPEDNGGWPLSLVIPMHVLLRPSHQSQPITRLCEIGSSHDLIMVPAQGHSTADFLLFFLNWDREWIYIYIYIYKIVVVFKCPSYNHHFSSDRPLLLGFFCFCFYIFKVRFREGSEMDWHNTAAFLNFATRIAWFIYGGGGGKVG